MPNDISHFFGHYVYVLIVATKTCFSCMNPLVIFVKCYKTTSFVYKIQNTFKSMNF